MTFLPATRPAPEMLMMLIRSAATRLARSAQRETLVPSAKVRRVGAAGLLLALGLAAAGPAVAQTVQPPADLLRIQGQKPGQAAPAVAQSPAATSLTLADAADAPSRPLILDGARWSCEGAACTASGGTEQPATRACRRVVQKFGPVTAFTYKGTELSAEELAVCNA